MKLTVKDRIHFPELYPQEGNIVTQLLVKDIQEKVNLTQEEDKAINMRQIGQSLFWDEDKEIDKDVEFTTTEIEFLKGRVEKLDSENKITLQILNISLLVQNYKKENGNKV